MQNDIAQNDILAFVSVATATSADYYGTPYDGDIYFARLVGRVEWKTASLEDKYAALFEASQVINSFNYIGCKTDDSQILEFPRGLDLLIPQDIKYATYEEAYQILCGRNAEEELNELRIQSHKFGTVQTQYMQGVKPPPTVTAGMLSSKAWRLLSPYFRRAEEIQLVRV